jgi:phage terminase large subunit-like protein
MARGLSGTIDTQYVKHVSGKYSKLQFKSCEQGLMKLAGSKIDIVHFDEQPPDDVYSEGLMRTRGVRGGGVTYCTFTPLLGRGGVVDKFWPHPNSVDRSLTMMDITECPHFVNNPDEMRAFLEGLAPWEYEARSRGIPTVGQGRIFDAIEADVVEPHAEIPKWWPRLVGLDFGGSSALSHPTAAVWVAYEEEADTLHVYDEYRRKGGAPSEHAAAIRARGPGIPIAWPHDGQKNNTEGTSTIADMYRVCGAKMMPSHALFKDGTFKFDAGILEMYSRFKEGRFRVSERCPLFMEEYRGFSRDRDGKVIKVEDDLLAAARYAMMMRRYAKTPVANKLPITVGMDYDPLANVGHSGYTN